MLLKEIAMSVHILSAGIASTQMERRQPGHAGNHALTDCISLQLKPRQHIRLASGASVRVVAGTAWITEDGCSEDIVLDAGGTYRCGRHGKALVAAIGEARLCLDGAVDAAPARSRSAWSSVRALLAGEA
jgi:hypothetical protein